jgi:peptidoglycan/xylan/chitin deacetylase (PgdA/CDA1 family)
MVRNKVRKLIYLTFGFLDNILGKQAQVVIFCYHSVSNDGWKFSVPINEFKKQMKYLISKRESIKLSDLEKHMNGNLKIDKPAFVVTFDDGYSDLLKVRKLLKRLDIKPCLFLIADKSKADRSVLDTNKSLLNKSDVNKLLDDGWEIGSHSLTHKKQEKIKERQLSDEISGSKDILEKEFKKKIDYYSYPKGYYTEKITQMVESSGYKLGLSMDSKLISKNSNPYKLPREGVDGTHSFSEFKVLFSPSVLMLKNVIKSLPFID